MPRKWYDWSNLRITDATSGQYYHIYLHTDGNWKVHTGSSNSVTDRPTPSDIYPHDLYGLLKVGSNGVHTDFSVLGAFHAFCQATVWVLLGDSTDASDWIPYGLTSGSGDGILGNQTTNGNGGSRTGSSTTGGTTLSNWSAARLCFTVMKSSTNTRTDTISINGTTTASYSHSIARFRFQNIKGGEAGNPHPRSTSTSGSGGFNQGDSNDDYNWGPNWFSISIQLE